jgi:hypothetical protein
MVGKKRNNASYSSTVDWDAYAVDPIYQKQIQDWWRSNNAYYYQMWNRLAGVGGRCRKCEDDTPKKACKQRRRTFCDRFEPLYDEEYTVGDCKTMNRSDFNKLNALTKGKTSSAMRGTVKRLSKRTCA